jgi:hypothetical protein
MRITDAMIAAARRAERDYHQKGRAAGLPPFRFIPTPIAVIRAIPEEAVSAASASNARSSRGLWQAGSWSPSRPGDRVDCHRSAAASARASRRQARSSSKSLQ